MRNSSNYLSSTIKRKRATKEEVVDRRLAFLTIIREQKPMTVRQVFYQASVRGLAPKSESGYKMVQTDLTVMRKNGDLPYSWLADNTRWQRSPETFSNPADALAMTARFYRKALWDEIPYYIEIWLEKDALSGVVLPVTSQFDVPLMVARGYASLSFLHGAASYIASIDNPTYIYHLGDFDPSGVNAGEKIASTLKEMAPDAEIHFERIAVNPDQIKAWNLPTRPTKSTDSRARGFGTVSVELDAIEPKMLRAIVKEAINRHLPEHQFKVLLAAEESERLLLASAVRDIRRSL
ncbi:MAG: hypothetical protein GY761_03820 [Hyphomicrobiales bacterium]|nr:hypothetical protein [Hyphomicrobiales bacterium]